MYHLMVAFQFLTRIPMPRDLNPSLDDLGKCGVYFPLVGMILGLTGYAIYIGAIFIGLSNEIAVCLALASGMLLTGGFHEDGLADTFDGFGGAFTKERKLEIMKDSRIGTYGTLAVVSLLGLRFFALDKAAPSFSIAAFIIPLMYGRLSSIIIIPHTKYSAIDKLSKSKPIIEGIGSKHYLIPVAYTLGITILLVGPIHTAAICLLSIFISAILRKISLRQIDGITGDVLGATNVIVEVTALIYLSAA